MADAQPWDISEDEWKRMHAPLNSAGCHKLAIEDLRRRFVAGEPIASGEYGPREVAAERALHEVA